MQGCIDRPRTKALRQLAKKFEQHNKSCPEPLYCFMAAVDAPPPASDEFHGAGAPALWMAREPHATSDKPGLGLVKSGVSVALSRDGFGLIQNKNEPCRLYQIGVLGQRDTRFVELQRKALHAAHDRADLEAIAHLRYELSLGKRSKETEEWLSEYERLSSHAWQQVPAATRNLHTPFYVYPLAMHQHAWRWNALTFALAWTCEEPASIAAPRTIVTADGFCPVEGSLRQIERIAPSAARNSDDAAAALEEQRRTLSGWQALWPAFDEHFKYPLPCCRAIMESTLCAASVLAIEELLSQASKPAGKLDNRMPSDYYAFRKTGCDWEVVVAGEVISTVGDRKGFLDIQYLLMNPGVEVSVKTLTLLHAKSPKVDGQNPESYKKIDFDALQPGDTTQLIMDEEALSDARNKVVELRAELELTKPEDQSHIRAKIDTIDLLIGKALGRRGRIRTFESSAEGALKAVRKRIREAKNALASRRGCDHLKTHLEAIGWSGAFFHYRPSVPVIWKNS